MAVMPESLDPASLPNQPKEAQSRLVSVIIPAYNAADHITAALESVFAQSFTDFEVIVVNDGSSDTDRLEEVVRPHLSRITYLKQENRGPSAARNFGIRRASGEWLAFLDSDDAWLQAYLEEQIRFLRGNPALDMVYCDAALEGDSNAVGKTFMQLCPSDGPVTFESLLFEQTQVITSGTVVRRESVEKAGFFDEAIRCSEDHDLWLRIAQQGGRIDYQRSVLLRRNIRPGSQGSAATDLLKGEIQTLSKLERELDLSPTRRSLLTKRLRDIQGVFAHIEGKSFLLAGEPDKAYESLRRANSLTNNNRLRALLFGLRVAPDLTVRCARLFGRLRSKQ